LADPSSQIILSQSQNDSLKTIVTPLITQYESHPLLGPNALVYSDYLNTLFFTDGGVFGSSNLENPIGSVFMMDFESQQVKPLAYKCLAYPSSLAISE